MKRLLTDLQDVYEVTKKVWMADLYPEDEHGGELSRDGPGDGNAQRAYAARLARGLFAHAAVTACFTPMRPLPMWSTLCLTNTPSGWIFVKIMCPGGDRYLLLNILLSSLVWRQDHNGFSHQDPGYVDLVTNKSPDVVRVYFPPDANCLLSVADHCFRSVDYINVIVSDKQKHLQYLTMEEAIAHCTKGIGIWDWASNDDCGTDPDEPDVVMACCGDIANQGVTGGYGHFARRISVAQSAICQCCRSVQTGVRNRAPPWPIRLGL